MQKVIDLYPGTAIYKVNVDELRERDVNARVMHGSQFDRLMANIGRDKRLESLPLCTLSETRNELTIISGHHRTRAARMANVTEIYVLVMEEALTEDQIKAKQLAHNAINGFDDPQILQDIYNSIADMNAKLESGITTIKQEKLLSVHLDKIDIDFNFEVVTILFMPSHRQNFDRILSVIQKSEEILVSEMDNFEQFKKACNKVSKKDNIRNISAIIAKMCDIVEYYYDTRVETSEQ